MALYRPTWVEISTEAFSSNVRAVKKFVGEKVEILAVLKADAYGHGADLLCSHALKNGATHLGVSSLEEGLLLRQLNPQVPILLLGSIYPLENFSVALENDFIPTVASQEAYAALKAQAASSRKNWSFHLEVDTGMGRMGLSLEAAKKFVERLGQEKEAHLAGLYSHLSCADSDEAFTREQLQAFAKLKEWMQAAGFKRLLFHLANSAGIMRFKDSHHDMVRPGLALYGVSQVPLPGGIELKPVLSWHTKIVFLKKVPPGTPVSYGRTFVTERESVIATLPVGYADGVPRMLSNKGRVLVKGQRCPLVGRVTMDQIMADVTGLPVNVGEEVVLIGSQGSGRLSAEEWAEWAQTIPYEIFCGISKRVPRVSV
ncbi:MAG: alanine racemase [Elusimicrobia bacterium]|nr:alanine racemase [Candidatus Obscuribacterium magneticum]